GATRPRCALVRKEIPMVHRPFDPSSAECVDLGRDPPRRAADRGRSWLFVALLASLLLGVAPASARAQDAGRIVGLVVSAGTGAPLSGVQVYVPGTGVGALSDQRGRFVMDAPAGTYELMAERLGMGTVSQTVTVMAGAEVNVTFELEERALLLDEVIVTGTAGQARRREVGSAISQLNMEEIETPAAGVDNILAGRAPG